MYRYAILIILALLLLGACAELPVPAPLPPFAGMTATPTVTASPTVTPSPSPTPPPTPTPTPQPAELLARAERAYEVGDWESAQVLYERLLPLSSVPQEQAIEAALGLGKTLIAREAFTTGVTLLEDVASTVPDSPAASEAQLRMADAYMQMGRSEDAVPHYRAVLAAQPILAPYAHEWLGDALFASGIYTSALDAYTESLTLALTPSRQVFLWEKIALTHAARNDYAESLAAYDTILSIAQLPFYRARIAYQAAETARAFGDDEEALRRLREIIVSYPEEEEAYAALVQLVEAGEPVDDLLRGKIDYYAGAYGPAVQAFYRVINGDPDHTGEPHYFAGLSYLEAGSPQLALGEFEMLIETHPDDAYWGSSWIGKARSLLALGRVQEALEAYRALPDLRPDHPRAAEALWRVAEILEEQGDRAEAADAFVKLADRYPDDSGAPEARFRAGLNRYMLGERETAAQAWQDLILWYPYDERANAARFWLGKNALEAGNAISATAYLSRTASTDPWGYYGLRAADLMEGRPPMSATTSSLLPCGSTQEQQALLDWMASWLDREPLPNLSVPPVEVLNDPRLARGTELLRLGHFDEGRSELEALREDTVGDALAQYHLALIFREAGLYRSSIIAAATVWRLSPADEITQAPRFLGCLVYPTYFDVLVEREAETFGFNPVTLYALLRQESLFEGFATSYAAAQGLMQVIPATGAEIAAALNWPPDYETSDLYRPFVSVRFGVWYLAQQRERFDGEIYPALAGYNGGPGNAARWWEIAGGDRDLFVEIIGFEETRAYVTRITTHHAHYRWLYLHD